MGKKNKKNKLASKDDKDKDKDKDKNKSKLTADKDKEDEDKKNKKNKLASKDNKDKDKNKDKKEKLNLFSNMEGFSLKSRSKLTPKSSVTNMNAAEIADTLRSNSLVDNKLYNAKINLLQNLYSSESSEKNISDSNYE